MLPFVPDLRFVVSGLLVGLLVGQTGVGGGSLMTPLLVLAFGIAPGTAVGTDLLYASATKGVGTLVHGLNHTVDWRIVRRLATGSLPGTVLALAGLAAFGSGASQSRVVTLVLGAMLVLTAAGLLARGWIVNRMAPAMARLGERRQAGLTMAVGLGLGVLVTVSSVGAGALGVTALLLLYPRAKMATVVGTDIAHAVPLTLLAGVGHLWLGSVNLMVLGSLLCGSIPGIIAGSWLAGRMPEFVLRPILALTLLAVGVRVFF